MGKIIKVFSAFSGIGCAELALKSLGYKVINIGTSEVDKNAIIAYDAIHNEDILLEAKPKEYMLEYFNNINIGFNFSTGKSEIPRSMLEITKLYNASIRNNNLGDISKINVEHIPDFDLFTYGFPCKNISIIGKQDGLKSGSNTQSSLLWECEKIIKDKRPKYLQMENVKNLVGSNHIEDFKDWILTLNKLGYTSKFKILNASNFNVPQNRERVIMISVLGEDCPDIISGYKTLKSIEDIMEINQDLNLFIPENKYNLYDIDVKLTTLNHIGNLVGKPHANKRIYHSAGYCPTLNSMNGGNRQPKIYNGRYVRKLSSKECWRLMGIDDRYYLQAKMAGLSESKLYERAGRGIVVPMLASVFKDLLKGFNNE